MQQKEETIDGFFCWHFTNWHFTSLVQYVETILSPLHFSLMHTCHTQPALGALFPTHKVHKSMSASHINESSCAVTSIILTLKIKDCNESFHQWRKQRVWRSLHKLSPAGQVEARLLTCGGCVDVNYESEGGSTPFAGRCIFSCNLASVCYVYFTGWGCTCRYYSVCMVISSCHDGEALPAGVYGTGASRVYLVN